MFGLHVKHVVVFDAVATAVVIAHMSVQQNQLVLYCTVNKKQIARM